MLRRALLSAFLTIGLFGCNSGKAPTYPVTGRVAFSDGKPLAGGTVEFQSAYVTKDGEIRVRARGQIQPDGTFSLSTFQPGDGAIAGKQRALVIPALPPGRINPYNPPPPVINNKYQRYDTSGLEFTVTPKGPNEFDIIVTPPNK